ncbi:tetratricopeptide repeat protein [Stakelama pacifica]|uniref:Tetratricopeptide repeat protein n=1 Tax=Stakelama pacifica TaxID=517720 RepID=A0A4R6FXF9_9SPHN|nr:tetratricopeptide repeat protein [Stakelama pacifica]TDN86669.1 tetratricopeptide repeat protein [Stakelama pacifica]GGO90332.1 hypothetical protein GCM10011329_02390 [Stakelama pacifica]
MKFVSKAAMAAALAVGVSTAMVATAPMAAAKDKKQDKEEGKPLELGKEFRVEAKAAQDALQANDYATAKTHIDAAAKLAKTPDEQYFVAALSLPVGAREQDNARMAPALETLIASDRTAPADRAKYAFFRGQIALQNKNNDVALKYLTQAQQMGYSNPELPLMMARVQADTGDVKGSLVSLKQAIDARNATADKAPEDWYKFGVSQAYNKAKDPVATMQWATEWVKAYPTKQNWRELINLYQQTAQEGGKAIDDDTRLDLLRLKRATGSLASQSDYFEYALLANQKGLPYESKAVIEAGRQAGTIPAGAANINDLYNSAVQAIKKDVSLSSLETKAMAAANGKLASQTGDAYLANGDYAQAIKLYRAALQKGGVDTPVVNSRLGIALALAGQTAEAKQAFDSVNAAGARKDVVNLWDVYLATRGGSATGSATATAG